MAEVIEIFPINVSGRYSKYPWQQWLNGSVWKLTMGHDFRPTPRSFQSSLGPVAKREGFKIRSCVISKTEIVIQAILPESNVKKD